MNWSPLGPGTPVPPNYKCDTNGEDACVKLEESKKANIVGLQCSTWSGKQGGPICILVNNLENFQD